MVFAAACGLGLGFGLGVGSKAVIGNVIGAALVTGGTLGPGTSGWGLEANGAASDRASIKAPYNAE